MKIGDFDLTSATIYRETDDGIVVLSGRRPPDAYLVDAPGLTKIKTLRRGGMIVVAAVGLGLYLHNDGVISDTAVISIVLGAAPIMALIWTVQSRVLRSYQKLGVTMVNRKR
jgi:hypothetical protein